MIAIVKIGGHQAIVSEGEKLEVDKIDGKEGSSVEFETLMVSENSGEKFQIGTPFLENIKVTANILEHGRGKKIRVYKMNPRKRYRRTQGHRQDYTLIEITKINTGSKAPTTKKGVKKEVKEV
ncbi:50S ribosomal protein L21 [Candidatus Gracilibacteria bacterium]|nr:50S ribosomal protein L21 [Candidatus Gracilibacteria bacterium]